MKNKLKLQTVVVIAAIYLFVLAAAAGAGGGPFVLLVVYSLVAIAGGNALLASDLAIIQEDKQTFRRVKPLRGLGASFVDFQHVFFHTEDLLSAILDEINKRIGKQGLVPMLQKKAYTDTDKNLTVPETREFFVTSSKVNSRGTEVALAVLLRKQSDAQSIQWWVLMRGFVDRNKKVSLLASAPLAFPFWILARLKQELDLASSVRTVYDAFYNWTDVVTDSRALHTLVFDSLVDTLDKHGVDISDLKLQRAQVMNINISGGRTRFGNVIQALQQAKVVQTGGQK